MPSTWHSAKFCALRWSALALTLAVVALPLWLNVPGPRAGLIAALVLLGFFSYGHLYELVEGVRLGNFLVGRHRFLLIGLFAPTALLTFLLVRFRGPMETPMRAAMVAGALAVAMSLVTGVAQDTIAALLIPPAASNVGSDWREFDGRGTAQLPDIYYVVLDGYARADVLNRIYQLDNSNFVRDLESLGFYVADDAVANYVQTRLSLAATFNMEYVDAIAGSLPPWLAEIQIDERTWDSRLRRILERYGYQTVAFESGFTYSEFPEADLYLVAGEDPRYRSEQVGSLHVNSYEALLLNTTLLRVPMEWAERNKLRAASQLYSSPHEDHRRRIRYAMSKLPDITQLEGPHFIFVHILAPHPPFVFDEEGDARVPIRPYSLRDGSSYMAEASRKEYVDGYRQQVLYLNEGLLPTLEAIIEGSETPPVIVLQADHGPGAYLDWDSPEQTDLEERISILNAVYLQGQRSEQLYPGLSSVNTFRVVFNWLFEPDQPLLADRSYYSPNTDSLDFIEVE